MTPQMKSVQSLLASGQPGTEITGCHWLLGLRPANLGQGSCKSHVADAYNEVRETRSDASQMG